MTTTRTAAVAGMFYPAEPSRLRAEVDGFLAAAGPGEGPVPKGVIVPHAGYRYSGPVAGTAYACLRAGAAAVARVVLLGPSHRAPLDGLAVPGATHFATPLGNVPVDLEAVAVARGGPAVVVDDAAHAREHSLEVQLPFLQRVLGDGFALVPLAVGWARPEAVAAVLGLLWGGPETLVVVSSDLSHYHPYETAQRLDARTSRQIEQLAWDKLAPEAACGVTAIQGLLLAARQRGLRVRAVDVRNSGDTAGPRDRVVGYGAYVVQ